MERAVCRFIQELSRYPLLSIDTNHVFTVHIITTFQTNFYLIVVECRNLWIVICTFYIHNVEMFVLLYELFKTIDKGVNIQIMFSQRTLSHDI